MSRVAHTANMNELPTEIIDLILFYIVRPSDVRSLCLVSKRLSNFATALLYRNVRLSTYRNQVYRRITTFASSRQLHHVRSLEIGDDDVQRNQICRGLRDLLKRLSREQLQGFYYHPAATPQARDIRYLWHTQPNLERLNFSFRMCSPALIDLVNQDGPWLKRFHRIKDITIDLGDTDVPALVERFLALIDSKSVKKATIMWPFDIPEDYNVHEDMIKPILQWLPLDLETLSLHFLPFEDSIRSNKIQLPALKDLELRACFKASAFLDAVVDSPIERLALRLHGGNRGDFLDSSWADIRNSVARMKDLTTLMVPNNLVPRQARLLSGSRLQALPSLRVLMLNYFPHQVSPEQVPWGLHPDTLTGDLVELALRLDEFSFKDPAKECTALIEMLERLPRLEVLNVFFELPTYDPTSDRQPILHPTAEHIFARLSDTHPLRIVAFGMKWRFGSSLEALSFSQPKRACYLRTRCDNEGNNNGQAICQYLAEEDIRYVYPHSDILEYAFSPHTDDSW